MAEGGWRWLIGLYEHKVKENRHISLKGFKWIRTLRWKKRWIGKAFLESDIGKHGGKLFPVNGDDIRDTWEKMSFWGEGVFIEFFPSLLHLFFNPCSHRHTTQCSCRFSFPWHIYHLIFIFAYKPWYTQLLKQLFWMQDDIPSFEPPNKTDREHLALKRLHFLPREGCYSSANFKK